MRLTTHPPDRHKPASAGRTGRNSGNSMQTAMKDFPLPDMPAPDNFRPKATLKLQQLGERMWQAALTIVVNACIAAVGQPSLATGFMIALALELGAWLMRCSSLCANISGGSAARAGPSIRMGVLERRPVHGKAPEDVHRETEQREQTAAPLPEAHVLAKDD